MLEQVKKEFKGKRVERVREFHRRLKRNNLGLIGTNNNAECTRRARKNGALRHVIVTAEMNPEGSNFCIKYHLKRLERQNKKKRKKWILKPVDISSIFLLDVYLLQFLFFKSYF